MIIRLITFLIITGIALLILKYTEQIVRIVGKSQFGEKYFGMGGTYNMWKVIAILAIVAAVLNLFGVLTFGDMTPIEKLNNPR